MIGECGCVIGKDVVNKQTNHCLSRRSFALALPLHSLAYSHPPLQPHYVSSHRIGSRPSLIIHHCPPRRQCNHSCLHAIQPNQPHARISQKHSPGISHNDVSRFNLFPRLLRNDFICQFDPISNVGCDCSDEVFFLLFRVRLVCRVQF